jgi:hypothetical protein
MIRRRRCEGSRTCAAASRLARDRRRQRDGVTKLGRRGRV